MERRQFGSGGGVAEAKDALWNMNLFLEIEEDK